MRIKFDITKAGIAAERTMRAIDHGLNNDTNADDSIAKNKKDQEKRRQRIERIVLKEFNMINMSRV